MTLRTHLVDCLMQISQSVHAAEIDLQASIPSVPASSLESRMSGPLANVLLPPSFLLAVALAPRFRNVLAVDSSAGQLQHAWRSAPNVEYKEGDAHALPVDDGAADLVVVAQALHWWGGGRGMKKGFHVRL